MTPLTGLSAIAGDYDAILCDVWGVLHDGVRPHDSAVKALREFRKAGCVVLITNAPRPHEAVLRQLEAIGAGAGTYDAIVSSGDVVARHLVESGAQRIVHVGAERDLGLYTEGVDLVDDPAGADAVVLAGLVDDRTEVPEDYRKLMREVARSGRPVICANPDVVVERGERLLYCAGALARMVEEEGGIVAQFGKPHAPIYRAALDAVAACGGTAARILVVGDGLPTDIRGAANEGFDSLFVTDGIHAAELGEPGAPDPAKVADRLARDGLAVTQYAARLRW